MTTGKAGEVLAFIAAHIAEHGYSPTVKEIGEGVGLRSASTVWHHLNALRAGGRVTWLPGQNRTLRVVEKSPVGGERAFDDRLQSGAVNVAEAGAWNAPSTVAEPLGSEGALAMRTIQAPPEGVQP